MSNPKKGGPAFPHIDSGCGRFEEGMTLRDYFAAKAMQAELTGRHITPDATPFIAERAYQMADAMLKARQA